MRRSRTRGRAILIDRLADAAPYGHLRTGQALRGTSVHVVVGDLARVRTDLLLDATYGRVRAPHPDSARAALTCNLAP